MNGYTVVDRVGGWRLEGREVFLGEDACIGVGRHMLKMRKGEPNG